MALDFSVLQGMDPAGAFFRGQEAVRAEADRNLLRQAQMEQMAAQRENMLAQRQEREAHAEERRLGAARRQEEDAWLGKMADLFGQNGVQLTPETVQQGLAFALRSRNPAAIQMMQKTVEAMQARQQQIEEDARAEAELARIRGQAPTAPSVVRQPAAAMPAAPAAPANLLAGTPYDIGMGMPAPVNALAAPPPAPAAPTFTREQVQAMLTSPSARIREQGKALVATLEKPERGYEPSELQKTLRDLKAAPPGSPEARALQSRIDILTKREPKAEKEPDKPVEVVGPDGNIVIVSAQEAIAKRMTPAKAMEGLSPKEIQKREASYPKTTAALRSFETQADTLIKNLEKLRDHPGLSGITGLVFGRTPAITAEARSAKADLDNILARGGFAELAAMRQASPTGGALGNISNQEVKYLRDAFGALDPVQDTEPFKQKINDVITQLQSSKRNVREEYDNTYEYRTQRGAAGGTPRAPAGLSPEDKQALDWANSNPKDPRAAQIKQRLGM